MTMNNNVKSVFIDILLKLLDDSESEIRNSCCHRLDVIYEKLSKDDNFEKLLKKLKNFENDASPYVKGNKYC